MRVSGSDPGGFCLHYLRPAHLAAVLGDEGVQRHVLALERCHAVAVLLQKRGRVPPPAGSFPALDMVP